MADCRDFCGSLQFAPHAGVGVRQPAAGGNCGGDGTITSDGYNLSSDDNCDFHNAGDLNSTDPKLGPMHKNGGPTETMTTLHKPSTQCWQSMLASMLAIQAGNPNWQSRLAIQAGNLNG